MMMMTIEIPGWLYNPYHWTNKQVLGYILLCIGGCIGGWITSFFISLILKKRVDNEKDG